ncbi:MAG: hypothetical protein ACRBK7_04165 [Acidimicrobiales bacterium]
MTVVLIVVGRVVVALAVVRTVVGRVVAVVRMVVSLKVEDVVAMVDVEAEVEVEVEVAGVVATDDDTAVDRGIVVDSGVVVETMIVEGEAGPLVDDEDVPASSASPSVGDVGTKADLLAERLDSSNGSEARPSL